MRCGCKGLGNGTRDTLQIKTCPQKNRSAMDTLKMPAPFNLPCRSLDLDKSRGSAPSRLAPSHRQTRHCIQPRAVIPREGLSQEKGWCHVPTSSSLPSTLPFPEETRFCWRTPRQLSTRAKAVCKSAPHRLFHLNDLPSLAGLSLSRACIQGNKSYQGKNGSKKLLKPQYPF